MPGLLSRHQILQPPNPTDSCPCDMALNSRVASKTLTDAGYINATFVAPVLAASCRAGVKHELQALLTVTSSSYPASCSWMVSCRTPPKSDPSPPIAWGLENISCSDCHEASMGFSFSFFFFSVPVAGSKGAAVAAVPWRSACCLRLRLLRETGRSVAGPALSAPPRPAATRGAAQLCHPPCRAATP